MTETQRRIKELKRSLPNMKEKVVAVAVLLALSLTMMASVSYAWYTLSFAPELGGVNTTVAANGNLEVALAGLYEKESNELLTPNMSAIGDSFDGKNTITSNLTWGNLINLSEHYGIEKLKLRPATLDTANSDAFLTSMKYSEDGRVEIKTTDFAFTTYMKTGEVSNEFSFAVPKFPHYGVRAISSVTYPDGKTELEARLSLLKQDNANLANTYHSICTNEHYVGTIQSIVQLYLDANVDSYLNGTKLSNVDCSSFVTGLYTMMDDFYTNAVCPYGDLMADMINLQLGTDKYTRDNMVTADNDFIAEDKSADKDGKVVVMTGMQEYISLESTVRTALNDLSEQKEAYDAGDPVTWDDVEDAVFAMIGIKTVTVQGKTVDEITSMDLGALASFVMTNLPLKRSGKTVPIIMDQGAFYSFERLSGAYMDVTFDFHIKATIKGIPINNEYTGELTTTADEETPYFINDLDYTKKNAGNVKSSTMVAADTYGLVMDLWVRTNAKDSILTLDGLVDYEVVEVPSVVQIVIYDPNTGLSTTESRNVYYYTNTATEVNEKGETVEIIEEVELYRDTDISDLDEDGLITDYIYRSVSTRAVAYVKDAEGNQRLVDDVLDKVQQKFDEQIRVNGFQSSNRVDNSYAEKLNDFEISATQGNGSCYIFYAENPEEADKMLELLEHMKLAFINSFTNEVMAEAKLGVKYVYSSGGKYTVPIMLTDSKTTYYENDELCFGITSLTMNEPKLITTVVYLDGTELDNTMVMSNADIVGSLNIQFSSTMDLKPIKDTDLSTQYISLSAALGSADNKEYSKTFNYEDKNKSVPLFAQIKGINASSVQAVFFRQITATQGRKMDPVTLALDETTKTYSGTYSFGMPGEYVMDSILIDGVEYKLDRKIVVTVKGFELRSTTLYGGNLAFTADNFTSREVGVAFSADPDEQPESVSVRFLSEYGEYVSGKLRYNAEKDEWIGSVDFKSSGTYTLTYLVLDDEYYEVEESYQKTLVAYLGLYTKVTLVYPVPAEASSAGAATVEEDETETEKVVSQEYTDRNLSFKFEDIVDVLVKVDVYTDKDQKLEALDNVSLSYLNEAFPTEEEKGLDTSLTWDGECYTGTFNVESAGHYYFSHVYIGASGRIAKATQAPSITAAYPDPPSFDGSSTSSVIVTGNDDDRDLKDATTTATFTAVLNNAPAMSNIYVVFEDASGNRQEQVAMGLSNKTYSFPFPKDKDGKQNGVWSVVGFKFCDVYNQDTYYDQENPWYLMLDEKLTYEIYDKFTVIVGTDNEMTKPIELGKGDENAVFMAAQNLPDTYGVKLSMQNIAIDPSDITNVKLTLKYSGGSSANGGYSFDSGHAYENRSYPLEYNASLGRWVVKSTRDSIYLAGNYTYTVDFTFKGKTYSIVMNDGGKDLIVSVYSVKPKVTITKAETKDDARYTGSNGTFKAYNGSNEVSVSNAINSTGTKATVYTSTYKIGRLRQYYSSMVTIALENSGYAERASLIFYNGTSPTSLLFNNVDTSNAHSTLTKYATSSYSWTREESVVNGCDSVCMRYVGAFYEGYSVLIKVEQGTKEPAGTIVAKQLVLVYGNVNYYVPTEITIEHAY